MFFIMAYTQDGERGIPITTEDEEIAWYATEAEAEKVAKEQFLCKATGYKVFEMD